MFKIIFLPLIILIGCDKLKVNRREDKVFPMSLSDFEKGVTLNALLERTELKELIDLVFSPVVLDRSVYEAIKKQYEEQSTEIVDIALDEAKLREFLKRDNVDIKINREIGIEVEGERKHTYMLHLALENKFHPNTIQLMLEKGALLQQDSSGNTPFFIAIDKRQNESLSLMLQFAISLGICEKAIGIDEKNNLGMTSLQYLSSLKNENVAAVNLILRAGADIRIRNEKENGLNSLHYAVITGNIETARLILRSIEDIEERRGYIKNTDEYGRTALHFASILGNTKIWAILAKELGDHRYTFVKDQVGATELHYAGLSKDIMSELRKRGVEGVKSKLEVLFPYSAKGFSLDMLCEKVFRVESVHFMGSPESFGYKWEEMIKEGEGSESLFIKTTQGGLTPIHYMVLTGDIELLELAIDKLRRVALNKEFISKHDLRTYIPLEAEKRKELIREATPFDMACIAGKIEVVEYMLSLLRSVEKRGKEEKIVLKLLGLILEEGKNTPLHYAVLAGKRDICELLMITPETKEWKDISNVEGKRAIDIAIEKKNVNTIHILLTNGVVLSKKVKSIALMLRKERGKEAYKELLEMTGIGSKEVLDTIMIGVEEREEGKTSLMYAIEGECELSILKKIVEGMSLEEVLRKDKEGRSIKEYESIDKKYIEELYDRYKELKEERAKKEIKKVESMTLLGTSEEGDIEVVPKSIKEEESVESNDENGSRVFKKVEHNSGKKVKMFNFLNRWKDVIRSGDKEIIGELLSKSSAKLKDKDSMTKLMYAAEAGNREIVEMLLPISNVKDKTRRGQTVLMFAVINNHKEIVEMLLPLSNVKDKTVKGQTALMFAVEKGYREIVEILLPFSDVKAADKSGQTALIFAVEKGYREIFDILLPLSDVNATSYGKTALMFAAEGGNKEMFDILLPLSNLEANSHGQTVLMFAAKGGNREIVEILLPLSDVNATITSKYSPDNGNTALMFAAKGGHKEVVEMLLPLYDLKANFHGKTALMFAAEGGNREIVEMLLPLSDVNATITFEYSSVRGPTALIFAAEHGHKEIVEMLLPLSDAKAVIISKSSFRGGRTALMYAAEKGYKEIVEMLLPLSDVSARDKYGKTALMFAVESGNKEVVEILIPLSDVKAKDSEDRTALMFAKEKGYIEIVEILSPFYE